MKRLLILMLLLLSCMSYAQVASLNSSIDEKTGLPSGFGVWFADTNNAEYKFFDSPYKCIGVSVGNGGGWALNTGTIEVNKGGTYIVSAMLSGRGAGFFGDGGCAVGAILLDANKQVVDWGPATFRSGTFDFEVVSVTVKIPDNVKYISPQVKGQGGGDCFMSDIKVLENTAPEMEKPNFKASNWNGTGAVSLSVSAPSVAGVVGLYEPNTTIEWTINKIDGNVSPLNYVIKDVYGNKIYNGVAKMGQKITFTPLKLGYYEMNVNGSVDIGNNLYKTLSATGCAIVIPKPVNYKMWSNPFGGQSPIDLALYPRLNITWDRSGYYNVMTNSHSELPKDFVAYEKAWEEKTKAGLPERHKYGIEVWNEPENELGDMSKWSWGDLAKTSLATKKGIQKVSPNTKILLNVCHLGNLTKYHNAGGVGTYDVLTLHPYASALYNEPKYPQPPEEADTINFILSAKNQLKKEGLPKAEIWTTEYGWTTGNLPQGSTLLQQAEYMVRGTILQLASGVKKVNPFRLTDVSFWGEFDGKFGFIRTDNTPKPVLSSYSIMSQTIDANPYRGQFIMSENVGAFLFGEKNKSVLAIWKFDGKVDVNITLKGKKAVVRDMFGNDTVFTGGKLEIGPEPVYIIIDDIYINVIKNIKSKFVKNGIENIFIPKSDFVKIPDFDLTLANNIDLSGDLSNWNVKEIKVFGGKRFENDKETKGSVKLATDGKYLYVGYEITGEDILPYNPKPAELSWNGAGMELFVTSEVDTIIKSQKRDVDYQFCLSPDDYGKNPQTFDIWAKKVIPNSDTTFMKIDKGYVIKSKIPISYFSKKGYVEMGDKLKIAFQINIADVNGNRVALMSTHSGAFSNDPSIWGNTTVK